MGESFEARVIAAFGRHLLVRDAAGTDWKARPFGRDLAVVAGDAVRCRHDTRHEEVHVLEILRREHALYRSTLRGSAEPVVANLTQLLVVLAPVPKPDLFVVDRYLAAAASADLPATLLLNKADLGVAEDLAAELAVYARIGYAHVACVARPDKAGLAEGAPTQGLESLAALTAGQVSVLVGQSGVGKSSLVRRLVPEAEVAIGGLMREEEGRHTTTASRMYTLPDGGYLIDSPGVRDFAPAVDHLEPRTLGFPEVAQRAPGCRFADCRHMREPGCAVRAAVDSADLSPRRYESYRRLRRLQEDLIAARGPGGRRER
jgi:ribosome biogenesis GTPase